MAMRIPIRHLVALLAVLTALLALSGCAGASERLPDYRYRLTVEVDTPEGLKTGSSVIEVSTAVAGKYTIPNPSVISQRVRGEAVAVDLGKRGVLFALLHSEGNADWASNVMFRFAPDIPPTHDAEGRFDSPAHFKARFKAMLRQRGLIALPATFPEGSALRDQSPRPMLVRFIDIADPTTVEKIDPDNLAATFGEGVKLKRITVQITDDPLTTGIEKRLGWLPDQRGSLIPIPRGKSIGEMPIGSDITEGDFSKGMTR